MSSTAKREQCSYTKLSLKLEIPLTKTLTVARHIYTRSPLAVCCRLVFGLPTSHRLLCCCYTSDHLFCRPAALVDALIYERHAAYSNALCFGSPALAIPSAFS